MKFLIDRAKKLTNRLKNAAFAVVLVSSTAVAAVPAAQAHAMGITPTPQVSFTFDDGIANALTYAAPALATSGYTGTDYVITGCVGMTTVPNTCGANGNVPYMTWDNVATLKNQYNWEIGSHTVTHPLLASTDPDIQTTALTQEQVSYELTQSKADLAAHGIDATAFAAPYGDYNNYTRSEAAKLYSSFRGFADIGFNGHPYNDQLIVVQQVQAGVSVATVEGYIDSAKAQNAWLVLVFHGIQPRATASTNPDDYQYPAEDLATIAAYVKTSGVAVTNMSNGLATAPTNLLPSGTFEGQTLGTYNPGVASTTQWTTNSPSQITVDTGNNGNFPNPTTSIKLTGNGSNNFVVSPAVGVDPVRTYLVKTYLNVQSISGGEVGLYIHQYDANGVEVAGQWKKAETNAFVEDLNVLYTPSAGVAAASVEVYSTGASGSVAYLDNVQLLSDVVVAAPKAGDVTGDGLVNIKDATLVSLNWGKVSPTFAEGDVNNDGAINIKDATLISVNWSNQ